MQNTVLGLVASEEHLDGIIDALRSAGFSHSNISILMPDKSGILAVDHEERSKAPEGTAAGAATGAVIGGAIGRFTGYGSLLIPGLGPFLIAGPIVAALSGMGLGSAIGGIAGGLIGLGIPEYEAKQYGDKLSSGSLLISVHSTDEELMERAKDILEAFNVKNVICSSDEMSKQKVS